MSTMKFGLRHEEMEFFCFPWVPSYPFPSPSPSSPPAFILVDSFPSGLDTQLHPFSALSSLRLNPPLYPMINTLYLPELREMLAENLAGELQEFCTALHPARTADFMDGLTPNEAWRVLRFAELPVRAEIFHYLEEQAKIEILETEDRDELAELVGELASDDRVDLLAEVEPEIMADILQRLSAKDRRDILRLSAYEDGTAGAVMTSEVARLSETLTVKQALEELSRQAEQLETIYYIYVVDDAGHLRGLVSARQLVSSMGKPGKLLGDLMETQLVTAHVNEDQEEVAHKVARYDLLAIPVVDDERHMLGIITHDDVIDVMREEATEDLHRSAAVQPLEESYLETGLLTLSWKRGIWLAILFIGGLLTAFALERYEESLATWYWLVAFIPLVISSGGNTGSQSAALIIAALGRGHITVNDWLRIVLREMIMGLTLGLLLGALGLLASGILAPDFVDSLILPVTLVLVVIAGALVGAVLPLIFQRLGLDPALMSNPLVAVIIDIVGVVIYMNVAIVWMNR